MIEEINELLVNGNSLKKLRNEVIGSDENKNEYIRKGVLEDILKGFSQANFQNIEKDVLKLNIEIINSFIITHSINVESLIQKCQINLTNSAVKVLLSIDLKEIRIVECMLRLMKSLAEKNLISIEKCYTSGFLLRLDEFLLNDLCFLNISHILYKICESSYYKQTLFRNDKLITKLVKKFFETQNNILVKNLLEVLSELTESELTICKQVNELNLTNHIQTHIRSNDYNIKIYSINLLINVYSNLNLSFENSFVIWSISILLEIVRDSKIDKKIKSRCIKILSMINKKSVEMQNIFYNLEGIDIILKEYRLLFTEDKIKEIDEYFKQIKSTKKKLEKSESEFYYSEEDLDQLGEYKFQLLECLAQASNQKEESRKKIIESKEIHLILEGLNSQQKILLSALNLILSLSRAQKALKNILSDYDINGMLFRLSSCQNIDVQIASTNSLCNFLLETNPNEITENINKLFKILTTNKHSKIRYNAICAIKNIIYFSNSNRDVKKNIMKKLTYEMLLSLIDDDEILIQEQVLLIFRVLVYKTADDIEEVFSNCKAKLLKKIEEKLEQKNTEIVIQSLYILCNISAGNEKHKLIVMEKSFMKNIVQFLDSKEPKIKLVCILILNNLISSHDPEFDKRFSIINEYNILPKLESINSQEFDDNDLLENSNSLILQIKNQLNK